jgi:hypothetical protein
MLKSNRKQRININPKQNFGKVILMQVENKCRLTLKNILFTIQERKLEERLR